MMDSVEYSIDTHTFFVLGDRWKSFAFSNLGLLVAPLHLANLAVRRLLVPLPAMQTRLDLITRLSGVATVSANSAHPRAVVVVEVSLAGELRAT